MQPKINNTVRGYQVTHHRLCVDTGDFRRGKIAYRHRNKIGTSSAFLLNEKQDILLYIPRSLGTSCARVDIYSEALGECVFTTRGEWEDVESDNDVYVFHLSKGKLGVGLYFWRVVLDTAVGTLYGRGDKRSLEFTSDPQLAWLLQLSVSDFKHDIPSSIYGGVIYHIFVDRFARGGSVPVSDGAILKSGEWREIPEYPAYPGAPLKNNTFYGGTLWGIIDKLDYIASLGTTAIYLSPIFESVSNHKYDTADYMTVDPMFGGDEALEKLIAEAEGRGIKIILDGVFNHTGADSIYFNRYGRFSTVGAYQSKESPYYEWFDFQNHPNKYTCWWDIEILPRINPDKPKCREYFTGKNGVIRKYSAMGVYGFRLDVADELSDDFIADIKDTLSQLGESMLYGEVWEDASNKIAYDTRKKYYLGKELDGVMNYPVRVGLIDYIMRGEVGKLYYALTDIIDNAPKRIRDAQMNLLGTHDTERILTILGGESSEGKSNDYLVNKRMSTEERKIATDRLKSAYTVLATLPGVPTIFYGDEAGLEGYHDPFNRMPYPWGRENADLLNHYTVIGKIRREHEVYREGEFNLLLINRDLLVFSRENSKYVYLTVFNNSKNRQEIEFDNTAIAEIHSERGKSFILSPGSAEVYRLKHKTTVSIK